jgi:hypothetical protein
MLDQLILSVVAGGLAGAPVTTLLDRSRRSAATPPPGRTAAEPRPVFSRHEVARATIELHAIRRRLDVAWLRAKVRDRAYARRGELRDELQRHDRYSR